MKRLYLAMTAGIVILYSLCVWKNTISYGFKTIQWRLVKSAIDCGIIVLAALYLPALLIGWCTMWLTRPITKRGVQITLAILLGVAFGTIGGVALEALCLLSVFAVDLLTGQQGIYGWWKANPPDTFMPYLESYRPKQRTGEI